MAVTGPGGRTATALPRTVAVRVQRGKIPTLD